MKKIGNIITYDIENQFCNKLYERTKLEISDEISDDTWNESWNEITSKILNELTFEIANEIRNKFFIDVLDATIKY